MRQRRHIEIPNTKCVNRLNAAEANSFIHCLNRKLTTTIKGLDNYITIINKGNRFSYRHQIQLLLHQSWGNTPPKGDFHSSLGETPLLKEIFAVSPSHISAILFFSYYIKLLKLYSQAAITKPMVFLKSSRIFIPNLPLISSQLSCFTGQRTPL